LTKFKFKILEEAELELRDAFYYYEYELPGLGRKFVNEFRRGIKRILQHPFAWSPVEEKVRKCVLKIFPYNIIYAIEDDLIVILAVAHQHRRPEYWTDRLSDL
jgi:plasmid stabilization system protein ParE